MAQHSHYKKRTSKKYIRRRILVAAVAVILVASIIFGIRSCAGKLFGESGTQSGATSSGGASSNTSEAPAEPYVVASASVGSAGDILIHDPLITNAKQSDGSYNFNNIFEHITSYHNNYDLMVMNLEVTFGGTAAGAYRGYPVFNSPDTLADAIKNAGVDLLLTANNHTYDTGEAGMLRTMKVLNEKGIAFTGTRENEDDTVYTVKEVNGIKIGIVCYTYSTTSGSRKALNGNVMTDSAGRLVNTFDYNKLGEFYTEAENAFRQMKQAGAEATMIYVHWGNEYHRIPNSYQTQMAQKISDMGYDVIVGGHPHVIQPFDTLTGKNGNKTVCIYSMGNAVSNQRAEIMDSDNYSGHTEDGMIFGVKFDKYSDGTVVLADVNILPTWVNLKTVNGKRVYQIVPLDMSVSDWSVFGLSNVTKAKNSYNRTMKLVGEGLNSYRTANGLEAVPTTIE